MITKILKSLFIFLFVLVPSNCSNPNVRVKVVRTKFFSSVAIVSSVPNPGAKGVSLGTGFAIDEHHILTAGHVCVGFLSDQKAGMSSHIGFFGMTESGKELIGLIDIVKIDISNDICLLYSAISHELLPLPIARRAPQVEDPVVITGSPSGMFPVRVDGYVVDPDATLAGRSGSSIIFAGRVFPGHSGSPILVNGIVIGLVSSFRVDLPIIGIGPNFKSIRTFLKGTPVNFQ